MTIEFTVYKGSESGKIVQTKSRRELGRSEAVVRITHSGVCGTDLHVQHQDIALGHEGIGIVTEIGSAVTSVKVGDRVGFGYMHYYCGNCEPCLSGQDAYCVNRREYIFHDRDEGSFGSHVVWEANALFPIPDGLESEYAGPLMCGGATVWSPFASYNIKPTDRVGIIGIGGLGHMAIQFASKVGCEVIAFSGSESKRKEAFGFGATEFYATNNLKDFSGIKKLNHLLITTANQPDFKLWIPLMAANGTIFPLTVDFGETPIPILPLIVQGINVQGSASASKGQLLKMLKFVVQHNIRPTIMKFPLTRDGVEEALKTLSEGNMRYRGVLVAA